MNPVATFSGLASGLDTAGIVEQLISIERLPIDRLESKQADNRSKSSRFEGISSLLKTLQDKAKGLDLREEVLKSEASSADETVLKASAVGSAARGSFAVEVTTLARAERTYSDGFASKTDTGLFGTGTLGIQVGTAAQVDITVDGTDTLESVATKINSANAGVSAAVIFTGSEYRLQVSGEETGAANAISFTETGVSFNLDDPSNEVVAATDASFKIDNIAMTRASNNVTDAIAGVTLDLLAEGQTTTVTVERDSEALGNAVEEFVDAYNTVMRTVNREFAFSGTARTGDSLSGDSTLRRLQGDLRNELLNTVSAANAPYEQLFSIGIEQEQDGTIKLDRDTLDNALAQSPEDVSRLLAGDLNAGTDGAMQNFSNLIDSYTRSGDGALTLRIDGIEERNRSLQDNIAAMELRLEKHEEQLRQRFINMETLVSGYQAQGAQLAGMLTSMIGG